MMSADAEMRAGPRFALRMPRLTRARVLIGLACLGASAITVNATLFQSERHPAPMFRTLAQPKPSVVEAPLPPQREKPQREATASAPEKPARLAAQPAESGINEFLLRDVQTELARRGYYKGEPDGMPGPATAKAIRDFQEARRAPVDGIATEALLADIRSQRHTMKDDLVDIIKRAGVPEKQPAKAAPEKVAARTAPVQPVADKGKQAQTGQPKAGPTKTGQPKTGQPKTGTAKTAAAPETARKAAKPAPEKNAKEAARPAPKVAKADKKAEPAARPARSGAEERLLPPLPVPVASAQTARSQR